MLGLFGIFCDVVERSELGGDSQRSGLRLIASTMLRGELLQVLAKLRASHGTQRNIDVMAREFE